MIRKRSKVEAATPTPSPFADVGGGANVHCPTMHAIAFSSRHYCSHKSLRASTQS